MVIEKELSKDYSQLILDMNSVMRCTFKLSSTIMFMACKALRILTIQLKQDITVVDKRPININPLSIKLPITAYVSIMHRISGFLIFLLIPLFLWLLQSSLASQESFDAISAAMGHLWLKGLVFVLVASFIFHLIAGIRHLFMDMHMGESLVGGKLTSWLTIMASTVFIIATAIWLWG